MKITAGRSDRFVPETHTPLWISARKLEALLKTAPTPLFVYDEKSLVRAVQALFAAFSWEPGFLPRFPVRMDPDPPVLRILRGAGCGALCRDGRELRLAAACGFAGPAVAYAPMRPDAAAEQLARELGAVFVLDGPQVLPAFAPEAAVLLLRQQGPLRISGRPIMGAPVSSAGMEEAELCRLAACLHAGGTRTLGLGMSLGDLCMDEGFYPAVFAQLAETAVRPPSSFSKYSESSVITVVSMPSRVPFNCAYSNTIASRGVLPVRSPIPNSEQLTPLAPYNHAVVELLTAL